MTPNIRIRHFCITSMSLEGEPDTMQPSIRNHFISLINILTICCLLSTHTFCAGKGIPVANNRKSGLRKPHSSASNRNSSTVSTSYRTHTVKNGDNLTRIARKYGVSVSVLKKHNNIQNPNHLYAGKKLQIPRTQPVSKKTVYHTVQRGENLSTIANKYHVSVSTITQNNTIQDPQKLYVGTKLKIPAQSVQKAPSLRQAGLSFNWPIQKIRTVARDGNDDVKSIGIIIHSSESQPVFCAESGEIKKIGRMRGYGNYVVVGHNSRYMTVYANLSKISVQKGQKIQKGRVLGTLQHNDTRLHFQINHAGKPLDALTLLPTR